MVSTHLYYIALFFDRWLVWELADIVSLFLQKKDLSRQPDEDPFDSITDKIPERPVSVAEGASYSLVILAGLAVAGAAAYAVFKELIFEPKEWVPFCQFCLGVSIACQVYNTSLCLDWL